MKKAVLLIEDEDRIREIIADYFINDGFEVLQACDGKQGLEVFESSKVDLVILDIMMPNLDGWSVCKRLRKISEVPVIILTAREEEEDKLMGFELGADEYVTKPFSPKVLLARAKTLLKRVDGQMGFKDNIIELCGIHINTGSREVQINQQPVVLSHKEYELLMYLITNKGKVLTRESILNHVWGFDYYGDYRTVDTHIKKLRSKLAEASKHICTVIKTGYKFEVNR